MHVICLCYPCTILLNSSCTQQGERASERADRTWTNGRTNQPTWTDERTNQPGRTNERTNEPTWNETNQRICNTQAQHNTAQPYEATAVPLPLHMKQKNSYLSERHVSVSVSRLCPLFRLPLTAYRLRLPYPSVTVRKYDYAVPCLFLQEERLYPAKMYQ